MKTIVSRKNEELGYEFLRIFLIFLEKESNYEVEAILHVLQLLTEKPIKDGDFMFKILLVEDDSSLLSEVKDRLGQWSYEVYRIDDFSQVFQEFLTVKPDLVVLDIQLPKYDGFHWCRMIRAHSKVPIIFLSSRDHPSDMVMSMQLGADDFIQKPFHFDVLIAKIHTLLYSVFGILTVVYYKRVIKTSL